MAGNQRVALPAMHYRVRAVLGVDSQRALMRQVPQIHPAFDLRLHNVVIDMVAEIGVGEGPMLPGIQDLLHLSNEYKPKPAFLSPVRMYRNFHEYSPRRSRVNP